MNNNFSLLKITQSNRISIKRAIARFFYLKNIPIDEEIFNKIVKRTQESGYKSGVKTICSFLIKSNKYDSKTIKSLLYSFTIEYNMEMVYFRMFPKGNKEIQNIILNGQNKENQDLFKNTLYPIVKANTLQAEIIEKLF